MRRRGVWSGKRYVRCPTRADLNIQISVSAISTINTARRTTHDDKWGMNTFTFDGSWNRIKGKLKQTYAQLTDDDLVFIEGKAEELLGRIQAKLGLTEHAVVELLNDMKESAANFGEAVRDKVSEATARVGEVVGDVKAKVTEAAGEACDHARESARTLQGKAENFVTAQPLKALLSALAVGFVAGILIRR